MSKKDLEIDDILTSVDMDDEEMNMLKQLSKLADEMHYDINTLSLEEIKDIETRLIGATNEMIWDSLNSTPGARLLIERKEDLEGISTEHFINELNQVIKMCERMESVVQSNKDLDISKDLFPKLPKSVMKIMGYIYNSCLNYFKTVAEIEKLTKTSNDKEQFLQQLTVLNKKVLKTIKNLIQNISSPYYNMEDALPLFKFAYKTFKDDADDLHIAKLKVEKPELKSTRKVIVEMNDTDKEHIKYINMANNLYQELMLDYVRDLEKQLPFSAKDLYNKFLEKLNKFKTQFHMPLTRDDSIGHAKECCGKIRKLMDEVSFISENAYTISMYK